MNFNKWTFIGHLGQDAMKQETANKVAINFTVAIGKKVKDASGNYLDKTTWAQCTYWRNDNQLGILPFLVKGAKVLIEGEPELKTYIKKDGSLGANLACTVRDLVLLGSKGETGNNAIPDQSQEPEKMTVSVGVGKMQPQTTTQAVTPDDDLPF